MPTKAKVRLHPDVVVRMRSPNQSARSPVKLELIVVHATQSHNRPGPSDLSGTGSWFMNSAAQASSHVCTDGDGHSARFVADAAKAWHCGALNSPSLGVEQIGFAEDGLENWKERSAQLDETARWIAIWSILHGIPIRKGRVDKDSGVIVRSGVVEHAWLGAIGGGHWDPGPYPMKHLLTRSRFFKHALLTAK